MIIKRALLAVTALAAVIAGGSLAYLGRTYMMLRGEYAAFAGAYYKRSVFDGGSRALAAALDKTSGVRHEVLYDLANLYFREAIEKRDVSMLVSSIEYYKESLRMKPDLFEAKRNLEIAVKFLNRLPEGNGKGNVNSSGSNKDEKLDEDQRKRPGLEPYEQNQP